MADTEKTPADEMHRVTVNLIPKAWNAAQNIASVEKMTRTDAINRGVQLYEYVMDEQRKGKRLALLDDQNNVEVVRIF